MSNQSSDYDVKDQIFQSRVRHTLTGLGGTALGVGMVHSDKYTIVLGVVMNVIGFMLSEAHKKTTSKWAQDLVKVEDAVDTYAVTTSTSTPAAINTPTPASLTKTIASAGVAVMLVFTLMFGAVGCSTTTSATGASVTVLKPSVVTGIQIAATLGTQVAITKDPSVAKYLTLSAQALLAMTASTNISPATVASTLNSLGNSATSGANSTLIADALQLYSNVFAELVDQKVDPNAVAKPALNALALGIQQGLNAGPIK